MKVQSRLKSKVTRYLMLPYRTRLSRNDYVANLRDAYTSKEYLFVDRTLITLKRVNRDWNEIVNQKKYISRVELSDLAKHIDKVKGAVHEVGKIRLLPTQVVLLRDVKNDLLFLSAVYSALTYRFK